jgi:hypothetical protein
MEEEKQKFIGKIARNKQINEKSAPKGIASRKIRCYDVCDR